MMKSLYADSHFGGADKASDAFCPYVSSITWSSVQHREREREEDQKAKRRERMEGDDGGITEYLGELNGGPRFWRYAVEPRKRECESVCVLSSWSRLETALACFGKENERPHAIRACEGRLLNAFDWQKILGATDSVEYLRMLRR
jgi:hypothetical protein